MTRKPVERIREHVHGLLAGSLVVLALFLASSLPLAFWGLLRGGSTSLLVYPLLFGLLLVAALREVRCWHQYLASAS